MEIIYSSKYIRILGKVYYITLPSILYYFAKYIILCQVYYMDRLCIVGSFLLLSEQLSALCLSLAFHQFDIWHNWLLEHGVADSHIIEIQLDDFRNRRLRKPDALLDYIDSKVMDDGNP